MNDMRTSTAPGISLERDTVTLEELHKSGVDLEMFPGATVHDFRRYPVLSEGGWYMVIKHQPTLRSISRIPWRLRGPVPLTSDGLSVE